VAASTETICYLWRIERTDGTVLGFTDHDVTLVRGGTTYVATEGMMTTRVTRSLGLDVDDMEVDGILTGIAVTADDIENGAYDNATVDIYIADWADAGAALTRIGHGRIGNSMLTEQGFRCEYRSLADQVSKRSGLVYQRTCDAKLGDTRCGVDLEDAAYRNTSVVVVSQTGLTVTVDGISARADGFFDLGRLKIDDNTSFAIRSHVGSTLTLWERPALGIDAGTLVTVYAGCKQDAETCRTKFNNLVNFRGLGVFMPGQDRLTDYPLRGTEDYDGGSLFS
jgi:uncharacterized phage protein (TIGR02218 family)